MTEVRALLMTDVVDSTMLSEQLGDDAAAALWAAHDRSARDLLRHWHGAEIDRSDGFLMLFDSADDALAFALAYHAALATLPTRLHARVGLHVGPVILRRNSLADVALGAKPLEVEGTAKPTVARVMSVAGAGQTLLTAAARAALGPTTLRLQSHGHWRMKGIAEPIELLEAGDEQAPFTPPPDGAKAYRVVQRNDLWLPAREVRRNLPAEPDAFVGRHEPLLDLARRFEAGARLVAVLGMGGTGKTRLVTRFGWAWLGDFPGGVWFCDLSQARTRDGIANAVAQGLDVPLDKSDPIARLGSAIEGRGACLVILDNFEQVARHAEETLGRWLGMAPQARFLVTTREVLGMPGEQTCALAPLPGDEAAQLFLCRAQSARNELRLGAEDQAAIAPLVKLLDGLPLAIELAAARVRVMPPRMLLARMSERFRLLASSGGRTDRQATLRATFDWSWDLLGEAEKCALAQLSVFEGGFTLEAVEAVLDLSACGGAPWIVDVLQSLVDKSFVRPTRQERFELLGSVQAYAGEHLASEARFPGSGPEGQRRAVTAHGRWFAALGPRRAIESGCADLANLAIACRRAIGAAAPELALGALEGAWAAVGLHGPFSEGAELAAAVCAMEGLAADRPARARALAVRGRALDLLGHRAEARADFTLALDLARTSGATATFADLMIRLASLDAGDGQTARARLQFSEALTLARAIGDAAAECGALNGLANTAFDQGRLDEAAEQYEAALARALDVDDGRWVSSLQSNLGTMHANAGRLDAANDCFEQALEQARRMSDRKVECSALCNLGMLQLVRQRVDAAVQFLDQALVVAREIGHRRVAATVECNLGLAQEERGRAAQAIVHFDAALAASRALDDRRSEGQCLGYLGRARARLGEFARARECFAAGQALLRELDDPLSLGILLSDLAVCEWNAGHPEAAHEALQESQRFAQVASAGRDSEFGQSLERARELIGARSEAGSEAPASR